MAATVHFLGVRAVAEAHQIMALFPALVAMALLASSASGAGDHDLRHL